MHVVHAPHADEKAQSAVEDAEIPGAEAGSLEGKSMVDLFSKRALIFAWVGLIIVATINYLDGVAINTYQVYAVSEFNRLSIEGALIAAVTVVTMAIQAPIAVLVTQCSLFSIFAIAIVISTLAIILQAAAPGVGLFVFGYALLTAGTMCVRIIMFTAASSMSTHKYRGLSLALVNVPAVLSVLAGALVAQETLLKLGWRWGFGVWAIVTPFAYGVFLVALFMYKRKLSGGEVVSAKAKAKAAGSALLQQDPVGIALLTVGIALFLLPIPLTQGGVSQYGKPAVVAPTVLGFLALVALVVWEVKFAKNPLAPKSMLSSRAVPLILVANTLLYFVLVVTATYLYTYLQVCSDLSISGATYVSATSSLFLQTFGVVYGALMTRFSRLKWFFVAGLGLSTLGLGLVYQFADPQTQLAGMVIGLGLLGMGYGISIHVITLGQAVLPRRDYPIMIAFTFISANLGAAVGGAVCGAIWSTVLPMKLQASLPTDLKDQAMAIMNSLPVAQSYVLGSPERDAIISAYKELFRILIICAIVAAVLAFLSALVLPDVKRPDQEVEEVAPETKSQDNDEAGSVSKA